MKNLRPPVALLLLTCALACCLTRQARAQEVVKDGVRIEFTIEPAGQAGAVKAGRDAATKE